MLEFPALEREGRRTLGIFCSLEGERTRSSDRTPLPLRDDVKQRSTEEERSHQPLPHPPRGSDTEISLDSWRDGKKGLVLPALPVSLQHQGWPRKGAAAEHFCCPHAVVCPQGSQQGTLPCCCLAEGGDSSCCWLQLWHGPIPPGNRSPHPCLGSPT